MPCLTEDECVHVKAVNDWELNTRPNAMLNRRRVCPRQGGERLGAWPTEPVEMELGVNSSWDTRVLCACSMGIASFAN